MLLMKNSGTVLNTMISHSDSCLQEEKAEQAGIGAFYISSVHHSENRYTARKSRLGLYYSTDDEMVETIIYLSKKHRS